MAVAYSQHATSTHPQVGAPSNGTLVLPSVANGDVILLVTACTSGALSSVSGCGAAWTQLRSATPPYGTVLEFWVGVVGTASGSTISFSNAGNVIIDAVAMSFTGATQGVIDSTHASDYSGTSTATLASNGQPFEAGQAVAAFPIMRFGGDSASGYTDSPAAFTTVDEYAYTGNQAAIDSAYRITTGAGTHSRQANFGNADYWDSFTALLSADPFPSTSRPQRAYTVRQAVMAAALR